jgi:DNA mismatch repair protein MutS
MKNILQKKSKVQDYIDYKNKYKKLYGENTVVLMQMGHFYEMYAVLTDDIQEGETNIHSICNLLNITVTKQNKNIEQVSYKNAYMAGVNLIGAQKHIDILIRNNYHVIKVDQYGTDPHIERKVTEILSAGTCVHDYNQEDMNYLLSLYIERHVYQTSIQHIVGISVIDIKTGRNYIHHCSNPNDKNFWSDEINRCVHFYNPKEVIIHTKDCELTEDYVRNQWDLHNCIIHINLFNEPQYHKLSYLNSVLEKTYSFKTMITPIETLNLERKLEIVKSHVYMIQYIHSHTVDALQHIQTPIELEEKNHLVLTSNSIRQLNIVQNYSYYRGKNDSLLSVYDKCCTPMGRRLFKERLLYPSLDTKIIQKRYSYIDLFKRESYETIRNDLRQLSDTDKLVRRFGLPHFQPNDWLSLYLSYTFTQKILAKLIKNEYIQEHSTWLQKFTSLVEKYESIFNFSSFPYGALQSCQVSIFQKGVSNELDMIIDTIETKKHIYNQIANRLSKLIGTDKSVKVDLNDKYGWHMFTTKNRYKLLCKKLDSSYNNVNIIVPGTEFTFTRDDLTSRPKDGSSVIIHMDYITELSAELMKSHKQMIQTITNLWNQIIPELYEESFMTLSHINQLIATIDLYCNCAKVSNENHYVRPIISDSQKSFVNAKGLRHPIVEQIQTKSEYVPNDIHLGHNNQDGILLFGTNACGKSTIMKAIGLNIVMAQAGFFVSADEFVFQPYTQIFTRILNNDNIFKSQSSFAVEVQELKSIMTSSNQNSLVLGDELCSGTETISALGIIKAGLERLCTKQCSFIFTSHLHQLTDIPQIQALNNLSIYHLSIDYHPETDTLIYNRKLKEGSGPSIYGLKVCEAMGMDSNFIHSAKEIVDSKQWVSTKQSKYNSDVYMDICQACGSKDNLETHHIKEQCESNSFLMIGHIHQNQQSNVVQLCKKCHQKITNGTFHIQGYKQTSQGYTLDICEKPKNTKKKYDSETLLKYKTIYDQNKKLCKQMIETKENIRISITTLGKIMNGTY